MRKWVVVQRTCCIQSLGCGEGEVGWNAVGDVGFRLRGRGATSSE